MDLPAPRPATSARRKNTSKACDECRRRRAKCDGQRPVCSRCQVRSLSCQYRVEEDGRRPAPKSYVEMLRGRIDLLEGILRSHSIDVDASIAALRSTKDKATAPASGVPDDSGVEELSAAFEGAFSLDESINYDQDGEIRYYGATSGRLGFQSPRESANCTSASNSSQSRPCNNPAMTRMKYDSFLKTMGQDSTPEELKEHLITLYFKWQQPWCQVVSERLFRESEKNSGRYSSPLLLTCILALGSRFTDRLDVRSDPDDPNTAGSAFIERAEVLLHYDLKWPSLTTIQALGIMIEIYTSTGQDAASWLHQGMANRLALDMGLNLDGETLIETQCITLEEIELRRQIFWALYCDDKLSAAYTGRVCTMLEIQHKLNLPSIPSPGSSDAINPYVPTLLLRALIRLSQITEKTILGLYAPNASHRKSPNILPFIESRILDLQTWYYDVPSELRIDRSSSANTQPQVYTLLMVYHTNYILLLRPLTSGLAQDAHGKIAALVQKASSMSIKAAKQICLIGKRYQQVFGSFRQSAVTATHCSLSAAVVLIHAELVQTGPDSGTSNYSDLQTLLNILGELSISWDIARRIRRSLLETLEKKYPGVYSHDLPDTVKGNNISSEGMQVTSSSIVSEPWNVVSPEMQDTGGPRDLDIGQLADPNLLGEQLSYPAFLESIPATAPSIEGPMGAVNNIDGLDDFLHWPTFADLDMDLNNAGALPGDYHFFDSVSHLNGDGRIN